jgi:hypothetical protein
LPDETFRAKLEDDQGAVVMDGGIVASDATYESKTKTWNLRLIDQSSEDFFSLLEGRFFDTDGPKVQARTFDTCTNNRGREAATRTSLFQPRTVLEQIFSGIGATYSMPTHLWEYEVQYSTGTVTRDSSDVYISRGKEDDKTVVEEITKLAGWRIDVQYQSWPSSDFHVNMQPTGWPAPGAARVLDGDEDKDGYEVTMTRSRQNWALKLREGVGRSSPDPRNSDPGTGGFAGYAVPPVWGSFAPEAWRAAPPDTVLDFSKGTLTNAENDPRNVFSDAVSSQFKVPEIYPKEKDDDGVEVSVHGLPFLGYEEVGEDQFTTRNIRNMFILELGKENPNTQSGSYYALYGRHPSSGEWGDFGRRAYSAAWASVPYEGQSFRRAPLREVVGKWLNAGDVAIGDPQSTVGLSGSQWLPVEKRASLDKAKAELVLRAPVPTPTRPDQPSRPATDSEWTVILLRGRYRTIDQGDGKEDWLVVHWERTPTQEATEIYYNAQYRNNDGDGTWKDFTQAGGTKIYSTAATLLVKSAGNGGASSANFDVRVRPVEEPGSTGGWSQTSIFK